MRLYKVYDVFMTSHGFVVIQTLSVTVDHQSSEKCAKFWLHSGLNVGNIVGLKGFVWLVRFGCRRSCWCRLIFEFGIGVGVLAGGLLGLCGLSIFVDLAGGVANYAFSMGGVPYFGAQFWLADSFDVEFYWFGVWVVC